jgi:hypothetical protein
MHLSITRRLAAGKSAIGTAARAIYSSGQVDKMAESLLCQLGTAASQTTALGRSGRRAPRQRKSVRSLNPISQPTPRSGEVLR